MLIMIEEIKKIIIDILEIDPTELKMETDFVGELNADSLMALEILATLEKKYKIKIPEESLAKMTNLKNVIKVVEDIAGSKAS